MEQKVVQLFNRGMNRDKSISKAETEFAFDNHNIRITARDHDTLLSVTNERGNKMVDNLEFSGTLIGWNVLNEYLILFTVDESSHIYRVKYEDDSFSSIEIFSGNLGFDAHHPIESITDYENDDILKIYWIDGVNVLRSMNFSDTYLQKHQIPGGYDFAGKNDWFDSNRGVNLAPKVTITKTYDGEVRQNGVMQYFITYYNKNGVQTAPIYSSPLVYLSPLEGSNSSDGTNTSRITIKIENLDKDFDMVRVYAIFRSSFGVTSSAFIVGDASTRSRSALVIDSGSNLEPTDISSILFLGSKNVKAGTMTSKDGTLFLGNLNSVGNDSLEAIKTEVNNVAFKGGEFVEGESWESAIVSFEYSSGDSNIPYARPSGLYPFNSQLQYTNSQISTFKGGEKYRFAVRFIKGNGERSQAFWIGDKVNPLYPRINGNGSIQRAIAVCNLPDDLITAAGDAGYVSAQLMVAKAMYSDRSVKAQGILSPTMFNLHSRFNDMPFAQASWIYRFNGSKYAHKHFDTTSRSDQVTAEIQSSWWDDSKEVPNPLYLIDDTTGDIVNQPEGYVAYDGIAMTFTVRYTAFHVYSGKINIRYYRRVNGSMEIIPNASRTVDIGGKAGEAGKLKLVADWLNAYESEGVEYEHRWSEDEILSKLEDLPAGAGPHAYYYPGPGADAIAQVNYSTSNMQRKFSNESREFYFVDSSILTLNSPEIEYEAVNLDKNSGLKLRIVGAARITGNISDYKMVAEDFEFVGTRVSDINLSTPNISDATKAITARPVYTEYDVVKEEGEDDRKSESPFGYMMYMWHKSGSIPGVTWNDKKLSVLKTKRFANLHFSYYTVYNNYLENKWDKYLLDVRQFNSLSGQVYEMNTQYGKRIYGANIDEVIIKNGTSKYPIWYTPEYGADYDSVHLESNPDNNTSDPIHVVYDSRPHAVLSLDSEILPYMFESDKYTKVLPEDGQSGPYAPWEERAVSGDKSPNGFIYRECNSTSQSEQQSLSVGSFTGFTQVSKDTVAHTITVSKKLDGVGSSSSSIHTAVRKIQNNGSFSPAYVMMYINNAPILVSFNRCEITDVDVNVSYERKDSLYTIKFNVASTGAGIKKVSYTALVQSAQAGSMTVTDEVTRPEHMSNSYKFDREIKWSAAITRITVEMSVEFYNENIDTINLVDSDAIVLHSQNTMGTSFGKTIEWFFFGDKLRYLDLPSSGDPLKFLNLYDNRYISVDSTGYTIGDRDSGVVYTTPNQDSYVLNTPFIDEHSEYAFIGELYHDYDSGDVKEDTRYGGISKSAIEGNTFIPAGEPAQIEDAYEIDTFAESVIDCSELYRILSESEGNNSVRVDINAIGSAGYPESLESVYITGLSDFSLADTLPTEDDKMTLVVKKVGNNYYTDAKDGTLTEAQKAAIADPDSGYRVLMMRMGYARRGKWRKYVNKYGEKQTSHTSRTPDFKNKRKGVSNKLDAYRLRFIGQDLLVSRNSDDWMQHSCTWKNNGYVKYYPEMVMAPLTSQILLPDWVHGRCRPTTKGHIPNRARNGLTELYIALCHKEGGNWKRVSNIVQVRGRNADKTKLWEFVPENEFVPEVY